MRRVAIPRLDAQPRLVERENERLAVVRSYRILDTPAEGAFDRITCLTRQLFNVPIAIIAILDEERIWFKSSVGLNDMREMPRLHGPGTWGPAPKSVSRSLVAGARDIEFYADALLETRDGHVLGALCILDRRARVLCDAEQLVLQNLADVVMDQMDLRRSNSRATRRAEESESLYRREHDVASALQNALLPSGFPRIENVSFDAVYVPAGAESVVGGDWYDAFACDPDHLLLSVGDVAGHGAVAASLMGTLRQSLRAFSMVERSPVALLQLLDTVLRRENGEIMVTAFIAQIDIRARTLRYASAGHPPPLVRSANGAVQELNGAGGPLGLRTNDEPRDKSIDLSPDALLVLYTDGLIESTRNVLEGGEELEKAVRRLACAPGDALAHRLREELLPRHTADDVAIMTAFFE